MLRPLSFLIALCLTLPLHAEDPKPTSAPVFKAPLAAMELADGDAVVFLGDSITHQCLYTQYIEDYFYTRQPKTRLHFYNAGVNADFAVDAAMRFDDDVTPFKPKYVTLLFGMNDGAYRPFDQEKFNGYQQSLNELMDRTKSLGATPILMTPTMFDGRAGRMKNPDPGQEPRNIYYNGVLALYGAWLREQAEARGFGFVDLYGPLNSITTRQRKLDPKWNMISDAIHPDVPGQCIMAGAIIRDMVKPSVVSEIEIAATNGQWSAPVANNAAVSNLKQAGEALTFTVAANALPWVLPDDTVDGIKLGNLHELNREKLTVRGLRPGNYALKIDGKLVGQWDAAAWSDGIELQANKKTPQYQQAAKVAQLNQQKNDTLIRPLRTEFQTYKGKRQDLAKATYEKDPRLDTLKAQLEESHKMLLAKAKEMLAKAKAIEDQIYTVNQPKPHHYEIGFQK